ncbi:MAG: hypothetical protein EXS42_06535 [Lacunisphaera sp.]|nr:hypothetical protein [Lacunisphaera sp.]
MRKPVPREFCNSYAQSRIIIACLALGHYHPMESVADKVPALLQFLPRMLLRPSRPISCGSDHVVILEAPVRALLGEIASGGAFSRVLVALDFSTPASTVSPLTSWARSGTCSAYVPSHRRPINGSPTKRVTKSPC